MQSNDLTEGVVWKKLLRFFFPILVGLLFQQLYNTADAVIVGYFVGDNALAAVGGSVSVITNLIIGFFCGLNCGATVLISQAFGSRDNERLSRALHTSTLFSAIIGLAITVGGYFLSPWILKLVNNPEEIMVDSTAYLRIYFTGAVPLLAYNLFQGTFQAVGDSRRPLRYLIVSCLLNIGLDALFVGAFGWGVPGVAWASVISMVVCMAMALFSLLRTDGPHRFEVKRLRFDGEILKNFLRIGLPSGIESTFYSLSSLIITSAVNGFGTTVVAAWTATGKLDGFYWVMISAFGTSICAFSGQCYGAGKIDRMRQGTRVTLLISQIATVLMSVVLLLIARSVYPLFLHSEEVIDKAIEIMWCFVPFYVVWSYIEVLTGTLRGMGDTFIPMLIAMVGTCILRVVWMLVVVPHWHTIPGVSLAYPVTWGITAIAFTVYYLHGAKNGFKNGRGGGVPKTVE